MAELRTKKITKDDVVAKLKDDGDFDRLRLSIIRKLKDHEELRESLRTIVRQSAAINRPGAEIMKPRQLSDSIYQEIGERLTGELSDGVWGIIRSRNDGVKNDIAETVESVYFRMIGAGADDVAVRVSDEVDLALSEVSVNEPVVQPVNGGDRKRNIEDTMKPLASLEKNEEDDPDLPPGFG